eukprot:6190471-Pleurochrysis_carterae.AAC.1
MHPAGVCLLMPVLNTFCPRKIQRVDASASRRSAIVALCAVCVGVAEHLLEPGHVRVFELAVFARSRVE